MNKSSSSTRTPTKQARQAKQTKQERRRDRREEQRRQEEARLQASKRTQTVLVSVIAVVVIVGAIIGIFAFVNSHNGTAQGQNTTAASTSVNSAAYPTIDGISCDQQEQLAYHIHVHISIYMNGSPVQIPANIGIASDQSCYYWIH